MAEDYIRPAFTSQGTSPHARNFPYDSDLERFVYANYYLQNYFPN